jgi:hypothetical protein
MVTTIISSAMRSSMSNSPSRSTDLGAALVAVGRDQRGSAISFMICMRAAWTLGEDAPRGA